MRKLGYLAVAFVLAAGCKSTPDDGYAIDFRIQIDSSVNDSALVQIATLHLVVTGAEMFTTDVATTGKIKSRSTGLRYKPGAQSGMLTFAFTALDAGGAQIASGGATVTLKPGTQVIEVALAAAQLSDGGVPDAGSTDMALCGNGKLDPGETCDPGSGSPTPCPTSVADCDDQNDCTTDSFSGSACTAACAHAPLTDGIACGASGDGGASGLCQSGACCKGCVVNGTCVAGSSDAKKCGTGGNACIDCSQFSASATCNSGVCSGCDATSCTNEGRLCGLSSCGYNCGTCADSCQNGGTLTHYTCVSKACAPVNPPSNCGLFMTCASATACKTQCTGDNDCLGTAFCDPVSKACKPKSGLGGACSAEGSGDHECTSPYVCTWLSDGQKAACAVVHCSGCMAISTLDWKTCSSPIAYGKDPRANCPYQDSCHQNFCGGGGQCDSGFDSYGYGSDYRPCGPATCTVTNPSPTTPGSTVTGSLCTPTGCQANQTQMRCCLCNAAHTAVDTSTCQICN